MAAILKTQQLLKLRAQNTLDEKPLTIFPDLLNFLKDSVLISRLVITLVSHFAPRYPKYSSIPNGKPNGIKISPGKSRGA